MLMNRIGWVLGPGRWRALRVTAAVLATLGVVGAVPSAAASASPQQALSWTKQSPATSPSARQQQSMAYDAATGAVVLFGGCASHDFGDTWTWNGTTWTKQSVAVHPSAQCGAAMAYDAATGTVVLLGDDGTWTWNGTTWTKQHPATSPPGGGTMAYDAATGTVLLFGGISHGTTIIPQTWTWNGTTWTEQVPAVRPSPRDYGAMAYDADTGSVVLFGGAGYINGKGQYLQQTWTWG
jgi:hypothetical protein